jgi:hypothetical protein
MNETSQLERIAKGVRGLSIAVWCLVAINVLQVAAWIVPFVAPSLYAKVAAPSSPDMPKNFESWEGLTFEEKVKKASVVLLTENKREGGKIRAIIREELKHTPNTAFHYAVGDEYLPSSISEPKENTQYGEGSLVLLQGSPAVNHGSYAIYNGSIPGLGDMPVSKVRDIVAKSQ